ncbi:MAG TPA: hypothetical protein VGD50_05830 [Candidatus Baltobacteraceae bacterium]
MTRAPLLGVAIAAASLMLALSSPQSGNLALALFTGNTILLAHALPHVLGPQSFAASQSTWVVRGWLGSLAIAAVYSAGGYAALAGMQAFVAGCAVVLVELRARARGIGDAGTGFALALVLVSSAGSLHVGGSVADLAFAAAILLLLDEPSRARAWLAVPLAALWMNVSSFGLLAPLFAFGTLLGTYVQERTLNERVRPALFLFAAMAVAIVLTPAGIQPYIQAMSYLGFDPATAPAPWEPVRVNPVAFFVGFIPMIIFCAWIGLRRTGRAADVILALTALLLALLHGEYLGIAGVVVAPVMAVALESATQRRGANEALAAVSAGAVLCAAVFALLTGIACSVRGTQVLDSAHDQVAAIDRLAADGQAHHLYCVNPVWCVYALLRAPHSLAVFTDTRSDAYPPSVREDAAHIAAENVGWKRTLELRKIDAVLAPNGALSSLLTLLPQWQRLPLQHADVALFVRR